eukprot:m.419809 g.419809  ORF g.419809 m.419809 type:complete len:370 (-) comp16843_c1_seq3:298-1407(-)
MCPIRIEEITSEFLKVYGVKFTMDDERNLIFRAPPKVRDVVLQGVLEGIKEDAELVSKLDCMDLETPPDLELVASSVLDASSVISPSSASAAPPPIVVASSGKTPVPMLKYHLPGMDTKEEHDEDLLRQSVNLSKFPPELHEARTRLSPWGWYATPEKGNDREKSQKRHAIAVCFLANFLSAIKPTRENLRDVCDLADGLHLLTFEFHKFNNTVRRGQGTFDHLFVGEKFGEYANGLADRLSTWFETKGRGEPFGWKEDLLGALLKDPSKFEQLSKRTPAGELTKRGQALKAVFDHWQSPCGLATIPRWREALELIRRRLLDLNLRSSGASPGSVASASSVGHDDAVRDDIKRPSVELESAKLKKSKSV